MLFWLEENCLATQEPQDPAPTSPADDKYGGELPLFVRSGGLVHIDDAF